MGTSGGLLAVTAVTLLAITTVTLGQFEDEECVVNLCPNNERCLIRDVPGEPDYVCECEDPNLQGYNCSVDSPLVTELITCYGSLCGLGGSYASPGYPVEYPPRAGILYLIYVPGADRLTFRFSPLFSIEETKDELYIGQGLQYDVDSLNGSIPGEHYFFDGTIAPPDLSFDYDAAWILFLSDKNIEEAGFEVSWIAQDVSPVIFNCPGTTFGEAPLGQNAVAVTWTPPTATDNSGTVQLISVSHTPGSNFEIGTTTVIYVFADPSSNFATCQFDVIVSQAADTIRPVIFNCPGTTFGEAPLDQNAVAVTWAPPSATDNSGSAQLISVSHTPGSSFEIGTTTVIYVFADPSSNFATCQFDVIVSQAADTIRPVIFNCPGTTFGVAPLGQDTAAVTWMLPTATDNSGTAQLISVSHTPGSSFEIGTTTVVYVFSDPSSNFATCQFDVIVSQEADLIRPVIFDCPGTNFGEAPLGQDTVPITWTPPTATDNSGTAQLISFSHTPGSSFEIGTTTVIYVFSDASSNTATCQFDIIVSQEVDNIPPVVLSCPMNIQRNIGPGVASLPVQWSEPVVTDNSGPVNLVFQSRTSGESFGIGTTTVTYIYNDESGNNAICQFTVTLTVVDTEPPFVRGCPASIVRNVTIGTGGAIVDWVEPTATDLSPPVTVSRSHPPGSFFNAGTTTTVSYVFTDSFGNSAPPCVFAVIINEEDTEPPVIMDCPNSFIVTVELGMTSASAFWTEPTATDISGTMELITQTHRPGPGFPIGATQVTYLFRDASQNVAICSFMVTVQTIDTTDPIISNCPSPSNIASTVELGASGLQVSWLEPTATDLGGPVTVDRSHTPGMIFGIGLTPVTYTFIDASGNDATCVFTVTVTAVDTVRPTISDCPGTNDIVEIVELGISRVPVAWLEPSATDLSGVVSVSRSAMPNSLFVVGSTPVTYTFVDGSDNEALCQFDVTVIPTDTTPPTISNCPSPNNIASTVELGASGLQVSWLEPTATDLGGPVTVARSHTPGMTFGIGLTAVTYTFVDASGNDATCVFTVNVIEVDTVGPAVSDCPGSNDIVQIVELGITSVPVSWFEPSATDLSGMVSVTRSSTPNTLFNVGSTPVIYTFTDGSGNAAFCEFDVTVIPTDTTIPTISNCPDPPTLSRTVELGSTGLAVAWQEPTATDLGAPISVDQSHAPGTTFGLGVTSVTYTFTDASGNIARCIFTVQVMAVDTVRPTVTGCPGRNDIVEVVELGITRVPVFWVEPTATDLSGQVSVSRSAMPNSLFAVGPTLVTYTYTDMSDNIAICEFDVTVIAMDSTPPTIQGCPDGVMAVTELGTVGTQASWADPTAFDISGEVTLDSQSHQSGILFLVGDTLVVYTFIDSSGNTADCRFTVSVITEDTVAPTISDCPPDPEVVVELGIMSAIVTWQEPTATDLSNSVSIAIQTAFPGTQFPLGNTRVTYIFQDNSGNTDICSFLVRVTSVDTTPPVISNCPININEIVELGLPGTTIAWNEPTATDLSGQVTVTQQSHFPNTQFLVGSTVVMYTFTDASGITEMCSFVVTITTVDTTPPVISGCPSDMLEVVELGINSIPVSWTPPMATDLSGSVTVARSHVPGTPFEVGSTTVMYTFSDMSNNPSVCEFLITVITEDTTPPSIQDCPPNLMEVTELGNPGRAVSWVEPTAVDISGVAILETRSHGPNSQFLVGETEVSYIFVDGSNNRAFCRFTVLITTEDTTPPILLSCPSDINLDIELGLLTVPATWQEPAATDISGVVNLVVQSALSGDEFPVGSTPVTYIFSDSSSNMVTCSFNVIITEVDTTPPSIQDCPPNLMEVTELGNPGRAVSWVEPTAVDISGVAFLETRTHGPSSQFPVGETEVSYIFGDGSDNRAFCRFTVIVTTEDTTPPTLLSCPSDINLNIELGLLTLPVTWQEPAATDISGVVNLVVQSALSGDAFPIGSTPVTYVFSDSSSNMVTCSFNVIITEVDTTRPVIVQCPEDIVLGALIKAEGATATWDTPTVFDLSGTAVIISQSHQSGTFFLIGTTEVRTTFSDASGNTADCIFDIIINAENPCDPEPCQNGAACVATSLTEFLCVCADSCYTGVLCETAISACANHQCSNGAICLPVEDSCTQYTCECPPCFTGPFCDTPLDACANNQCQNGAQCVQDEFCDSYICECPACYTGEFCEQAYNACDDSACMNGGVCLNIGDSCTEYTCSCGSCFTGAFCQLAKDACSPSPCQNNGVCVSSFDDACFAYSCQCQGCFTGYNCEIAITPACASSPCRNGGVCSNIPGTCSGFSCECLDGLSGVRCEDRTATNVNPCNSSPCDNGATCLVMDGQYYICVCRPGYIGINCGTPRSVNEIADPCSQSPCLNGASCMASYNSLSSPQGVYIPQYTCICQAGTTGGNCQFTTADIPTLDICNLDNRPDCENGGSCANAYHSYDQDVDYYCFCPSGFVGHNCDVQVTDPCASNPCQNDGACFSFNTYYTCTCQTGYTGVTCEEISSSDISGPTIPNCPTDPITVTPALGSQQAIATWPEPFAFDPSGPVELIYQSHQSGTAFPIGSTCVAYVFNDQFNNPSVCAFVISVRAQQIADNIPPVVTGCPSSPITAILPPGASRAMVTWVEPTATDNSQLQPTVTHTNPPGSLFALGTTQVTYIFRDASGNAATCIFDVVVIAGADTTPPTIFNCPGIEVIDAPAGATRAVATWVPPTATDSSGIASVVPSATPGELLPIGLTTVTYTFTDNNGNEAVCRFQVLVISRGPVDNQDPVIISCPNDIIRQIPNTETSLAVSWVEPTATDNLDADLDIDRSHNPGEPFPVGETLVTYTFTDDALRSATCSFTVNILVSGVTDDIPPTVLNCPQFQLVNAASGANSAMVTWVPPTATDASGIASVEPTATPGESFPLGLSTVTYTFTDNNGNEAECTFQVFVIVTDNIPPTVLDCPQFQLVDVASGANSAEVIWVPPTATDASGIAGVVSTATPGESFPLGLSTVTYTFTDNNGNEAECTFQVFVREGGPVVDNLDPVIIGCPNDIIRQIPNTETSLAVSWVEPTATDNLDADLDIDRSHNPGEPFPVGETLVTYTFTDDALRSATCSFTVNILVSGVTDDIPPTVLNCPQFQLVNAASGANSAMVTWVPPTATDASGIASVEPTATPGESFPLGLSTVTYTFTDNNGNEAECTFQVFVMVTDNIPPTVLDCPQFQLVDVASGANSAEVIWVPPTASDASGIAGVVSTSTPGESFPLGLSTVTYTFTDNNGNEAECTFQVFVREGGPAVDNVDPVITGCPNDIIRQIPNTETSLAVSWAEPTATDNLDADLNVTGSHTPGESFPVGETLVTYTFTDDALRSATCSFTVNVFVSDTTPPAIVDCPGMQVVNAPTGATSAIVTWTPPTATDDSGIASVDRTSIPGQSFPIGMTPVVYTFTDNNGIQAVCEFQVIVISSGQIDTEDPVIDGCPDGIVRSIPITETSVAVSWVEPTATDNLDTSLTIERSHAPGDPFDVGQTVVFYTFTDDAQRTAICIFTITVSATGTGDLTLPVISGCPINPVVETISSVLDSGSVTWDPEPSASDDSGMVIVTSSHEVGDEFPVGTTLVTYSFQDASGNLAICSFDVIVERGTYPCAGNPCPSEELCFYSPSQFICRPPGTAVGRRKRDILDTEDKDVSCPCENGGSCLKDERDEASYYCKCPVGYSGILCQVVDMIPLAPEASTYNEGVQWTMLTLMGLGLLSVTSMIVLLLSAFLRTNSSRSSKLRQDDVVINH